MLDLKSREYKCMLNPFLFADQPLGVAQFRQELRQLLRSTQVAILGKFKKIERRRIAFLDTADQSLRRQGLLLRRRTNSKAGSEYTLKCRNPDRFLAGHANLKAAPGLKPKLKFEEDIAAPFLSRYSLSSTVSFDCKDHRPPVNLRAASQLFPGLAEIQAGPQYLLPHTSLGIVRDMRVQETVFSGPTLVFDQAGSWGQAKLAIILWFHQTTKRLLVAEVSFRYDLDGKHDFQLAQKASTVYELLQKLDWCLPASITKTAFMYG